MWAFSILVTLLLTTPTLQDISNNQIDGSNPLEEAKAEILKEQNLQNVGGLLNSFMHSEGAKHLGDILSNAATGDNAGDILQGLGSVLGHGQGLDPSTVGMMLNLFQQQQSSKKNDEGIDMNVILQLLGSFMGQSGAKTSFWDYVPMILQTANAFLGPEAEERARSHVGHADLMPPIIEKLHILFDHFINSELGKNIMNTIGAQKFVKFFADENGKMSYRRFVDMLENHSVRKHWIRMVTNKIAKILSHFSDRKIQKKYLTTFQHFVNSILKSQGYPKSVLFDSHRPTETLTALVNYFAEDTLKIKFDGRQYVKPFVDYVQELFRLAETKGILDVDSNKLSDKLADTINMEIIEPLARVNRAFRFAKKTPKCDRYVMCLVNQESENEKPSLPGLRPLLSKSSSLIFSWFLTSFTKTPYILMYNAITEDKDCTTWYVDACHDFHLEEIKVKQNFVHNEL